jgi:regulator of ribosome biosynthesis
MSIEEDNTLEVVPQSDPRPAKKRKISKEKKEKFVNKAPEEDVETKMAFPTVLHKEEGDSTMFVDAGNLMVANLAVDAADITTSNMTEHVTQCTQELVNRLFMLKPIPSDVGRAVTLPARRTLLPREKPMPKPKAKTVWEQFAEKKGIVKKKKLTRKFDEDIGDWVSTYGRGKKLAEKQKDWVREVKADYVPKVEGGDPFLDSQMEKKDKIAKQKERERKNKLRGEAVKRTAVGIKDTISKLATASHGKFDKWT